VIYCKGGIQMIQLVHLNDVATRCNVSRRNVYEWVKKGILVPAKRDRPVTTGALVFEESDVAKLEKLLTENITVHAAAKKIGVPYLFFNKWLDTNGVVMEQNYIGDKTKYFVKVQWLDEHQNEIIASYEKVKGKKRKRVGTGNELTLEANGVRLFERLEQDGAQLLVINTNPVKIRNSTGIINVSLDPNRMSDPCLDTPYSGYKGSITCRIPKHLPIDSSAFEALEKLVYYMGTKNIRVFEEENLFVIVCRSGFIPFERVIKEFLEKYLQEGVYCEEGGQLVLGDVEKRLNIGVRYSSMGKLQKAANLEGVSVQVFISRLVDQWFNEQSE
jgi:predicted DNA-binding transcriptional regulator AlpA